MNGKKSNNGENRSHPQQQNTVSKRLFGKPCAFTTAALVLLAVAAGIFGIVYYHAGQQLNVAYYGIPESAVNAIDDVLKTLDSTTSKKDIKKIQAVQLTESDIQHTTRIAKKYDLLFMWNGARADNLAEKAVSIPENVYNFFPMSIKNAGKVNDVYKMLPLLLDHYELACYRTYRNDAGLALPETFGELESYLYTVKKYADYPLICAGKTDATLTAFVSAFTESLAGSEGYTAFIKAAAKAHSLADVLNVPLGKGLSFSSILGLIKQWQHEGLIHPQWYNVTEKDVEDYMKERRLGAIFMPLSEHRIKPLILIKYYDAVRFPESTGVPHGLIAPTLIGMAFKNNASKRTLLEYLAHTEVQTKLSQQSKLAPASGRAEAHDVQADDVRFWAASCKNGPMPELGLAAFESPVTKATFAEEIRTYMEWN